MATSNFKNGNFNLLSQIDPFTRLVYVSSIKDEKTMIKLLVTVINNNDEYKVANTLFNLLYKDSRYLNYIIELLNNNLVELRLLKKEVTDDLINNTSWAFDYFLNNLDKLYVNKKAMPLTESFITYTKDNNDLYRLLLDKTIDNKNEQVRDTIMYGLIKNNPDIEENDLLRFINNDNGIKSRIPYFYTKLSKKFDKYSNIKNIIVNNFELFFDSESSKKMELYSLLSDEVDIDRIKEYKDLYRLYHAYENSDVDLLLTTLINRNDYYFLNDILALKDVEYIGSGTTTTVYKVEDKVIKFTKNKHEENTFDKKIFLLAPTITKYISKNEEMMVLEIQDYLSDTYEGIGITKEDIINWNTEMEKLGYVVTDPLCSCLKTDNFGFLKDYRDANIDLDNPLVIPEWFKKRPLVLYDIDLIYRKEDEHKKIMKFH